MNDKSNTGGQFICSKCGKSVYCLIENLCQDCYNLKCQEDLPCFSGQIFTESQFNYKCPNCKGEFNQPSYKIGYTTSTIPLCPWCGREMRGL